ncbi:MAG: hypothetical protein Q4B91_03515 [Atopobiaceae bacterium]|nr:hypothetical protein [Atopobiaceae bacterium]
MASGVRVRINSSGARALLTDPAVAADLMARAEAIAGSACAKASPDEMRNDPFTAVDASTAGRARVRVVTSSPHGIRSQNRDNTLLKSVDAGR